MFSEADVIQDFSRRTRSNFSQGSVLPPNLFNPFDLKCLARGFAGLRRVASVLVFISGNTACYAAD